MNSSRDELARAVAALKEQQAEIAVSACMQPKKDLHSLGEMAGRYQGLQQAIDTILSILRDDEEKEKVRE
jgi:hypothetical protein